MRTKRILCFVAIVSMLFVSSAITAFASTSGYVRAGHNINITLNGTITFVKGVLVFPDKVTYYASMSGSDDYLAVYGAEDILVQVTPGTNTQSLGTRRFFYPNNVISGTDVSCGYNGAYAQMTMECVGNSNVIKDYDNN